MRALHISLTDFQHQTRVLKETKSLVTAGTFEKIFIAALSKGDLKSFEKIDEYRVLKRFRLISGRGRFANILKYFHFAWLLVVEYRKKNISVVSIHSLALLPIGFLLKVIFGAHLVYDTHELETETFGLSGSRKKISKIIEKTFIGSCSLVIVVGASIARWYKEKYPQIEPVVVLNCPPRRQSVEKKDIFREKLGIAKDSTIFLYQGGLSPGRGIELLLETFKSLPNNKQVVVFMGYGLLEPIITNAAQSHDTIFFHPAVAPEILLDYTSSADIGFAMIDDSCLSYYYSLPNKFFEYIMADLPVIASGSKEMAQLIEIYKVGVFVENTEPQELLKRIQLITKEGLLKMKNNFDRAKNDFCWERQEEVMVMAYREIMS